MIIKLRFLGYSPALVRVLDMADNDRTADVDFELQSMRGTFSQLLFADDLVGLEAKSSETFTHLGSYVSYLCPYSKQDLSNMLSFGMNSQDEAANEVKAVHAEVNMSRVDQKKPTPSSSSDLVIPKHLPKSKRRGGFLQEVVESSSSNNTVSTAPVANKRSSKRSKTENVDRVSNSQTKARGGRLGEKVAALQQLVSPYGKTDTVSVLDEAMGYIRFLHKQVEVLCSPYLQQLHPRPEPHEAQANRNEELGSSMMKRTLRSRGLCLMPVGCAIPVAAYSGADFWSPAIYNVKLTSPRHHQ